MTTPLVRALVRLERIKRASKIGSELFFRTVSVRGKVLDRMSTEECLTAAHLVSADSRAEFRETIEQASRRRRAEIRKERLQ